MMRMPFIFLMLLAPTSVASYAPSDMLVSHSVNTEEEPDPKNLRTARRPLRT